MINPAGMYELGLDTTFELDKFAKPRLREESELIKNTVLYILFTKKGQYPSLPHIGMDIENLLYSFYDDINESSIVDELISQCAALGRYVNDGTIIIRKIKYKNQPSLMIHIESSPIDTILNQEESNSSRFQIGITFDELNHMIYNVTEGSVTQ